MVHEFLRKRYGWVYKPHFEHQEEKYEEYNLPAPLHFEVICREVLAVHVIDKEENEGNKGNVDREPDKPAIPGDEGEEQ
jgi:hypothetical protein